MNPSTNLGQAKQTGGPGHAQDTGHDAERTHSFLAGVEGATQEQEAEMPAIAGYEIREVLGRGGMGIVYKAWQTGLRRHVALKMILAGEHAEAGQVARFRSEAEAVAQLQHANIVRIYDIGEYRGRPFFCQEYVDAGPLSRKLAHQPQPPERAARLLEVLARAIHHSHQKGIVHRDLKPANVLLARSDHPQAVAIGPDGETFEPKIGDFGLAKHLESGAGQTHSGAIVGTPAYMAPEQAAGKSRDIGPAADVYSLGAILYELLCGRPPFSGEHTLDVLHKVIHEEPLPPTRQQPRIPRDLETICVKCLAKEPQRRYSSALALAQDLERFSAGEPILARREGLVGKALRKLRRQRWAALVIASILVISLAVGAILLQRSEQFSRVQEIENRLRADFDGSDWTEAKVSAHESRLEDLTALDAERGERARQALLNALYAAGKEHLQAQSTLRPVDESRVKAIIALLNDRSVERAEKLRRDYRDRLAAWEPFFTRPAGAKKDEAVQKSLSLAGIVPGTLMPHTCAGDVRLEALWTAPGLRGRFGLAIQADSPESKAGYAFLLEVPDPPPAKGSTSEAPFGEPSVKILRNGVVLREGRLAVNPARVKQWLVQAQRVGDRLTLRVNEHEPLEFEDIFPLRGNARVGWIGPEVGDAPDLRGWRKALPATASALERGNELFQAGKFQEALLVFQQQGVALLGTPAGQEARFKEAITLERLRLPEDSMALLQVLAQAEGERWPFLAACHVWMQFIKRGQFDKAEEVLEGIQLRHHAERVVNLAALIPDEMRFRILSHYRQGAGGLGLFRHEPQRVRNTERCLKVEELLGVPFVYRGWSQLALLRAYRQDGQVDKAARTLEKWLAELPVDATPFGTLFASEYGWLMRETGQADKALAEVERRLFERPGVFRTGMLALLIERARIRAVMGQTEQAERDVAEYLAMQPDGFSDYRTRSHACLVLGFLRSERGDPAGAKAAWEQGIFAGNLNDPELRQRFGGGIGIVNALMLASLTGELKEKQVEDLLRGVLTDQLGGASFLNLADKNVYRTATAVLKRMWHTPRGKAVARKMILQTVSLDEYLRLPMLLVATEYLRLDALGEKHSADQEELLWQLNSDALTAYSTGKVADVHWLQLAMLWKKGPTFLAGTDAVKRLPPPVRGPFSYALALRFEKLGRPVPERAALLELARKDATAGSRLQVLCDLEINRLGKKSS